MEACDDVESPLTAPEDFSIWMNDVDASPPSTARWLDDDVWLEDDTFTEDDDEEDSIFEELDDLL